MTSPPRIRARPLALLGALLLLTLSTTVVLAQDEALGGKLRTGETVTIAADETVEGDLYVAGGTVFVDGTVNGDLVVAGGDVRVNGTVSGDLVAAGGTVTISGTVEGDARVAGGQLTVSGDIGEDLLVAGGQATIADSGSVGEDVIASVGQLAIAGQVAGGVEGAAGTYSRTGSVGGSENVAVGEDADPDAEPVEENLILDAVRHFVVVVLIGALALWLMPRVTRASAELIRRRPLASLGVGVLAALSWLVGCIAVVILMIVAAILFGLIGFGEVVGLVFFAGLVLILVATFAFIVIVSYLADAIVGLAIAGLVRRDAGSYWADLGLLAAGAALVVILTSLPVEGGFWIKLVVAILGLGALTLAAWTGWRARRAVPVDVAPPQSGL